MKKYLWLVVLIFTTGQLKAQDETWLPIDLIPFIGGTFNKPYGDDWSSDGGSLRANILPFTTEMDLEFISDETFLIGFGLSGSYQHNTGRYDDYRYSEGLSGFNVQPIAMVSFAQSQLTVGVGYGQLFGSYMIKSGYKRQTKNHYLSGLIEFREYAGRIAEEDFFPAWGVMLSGNLGIGSREIPMFGYSEFQIRQGPYAQNLNSIHGLLEINVLDLGLFERAFLLSPKIRVLGGKYSVDYSNARYWGGGTGLDVVVANTNAISFDADYLWGQWQNRSEGWYIGITVNVAVIPKIWTN